ncbi:reverse transcriptase domain-containing protein [Tanacetum coccineum]
MPFSLRNVRATYQRLVDKAFHKQIGINLEVYVNDLVIKIRTEDQIVRDIEETFKTLREINMKLNPKKCTFGVEEGMFLGYKVNTKGLKVCPDKVDAVLEKSLPFFKTLKKCTKKSDFHWTAEAEEAFKQMKQLIAELPMLTAPMEKEELIVYLEATKETVSAVLMTEREAKQMPIYFVSRALRGPELNYTSMEKPRVSVKGQILADYIVERPEEDSLDTLMEVEEELPEPWILFIDGSSCTDGFGAGLILTNPEGMEFTYALRFRIAEQIGVKNLQENVDSRLVANLVNEAYVAKEGDMIRYLEKVRTLTNSFKAFSIRQVLRSENKKADALSKIASTSFAHLSKQVLVEELKEKSISEVEILAVVEEEGDTWMTPIFKYLAKGTLPADVKKARAVRRSLQANYVLREIHEGSCSMHTVHKPVPRNPQQKLTPITSPWPFYKWRIDIAGPFSKGPGKVKFLIVTIDYFTKWIEAKPVATITGNQIKKFVWDNIVCRFRLHGEIISDNGKQFRDDPFKDWCEKLCIRQHFASVKHPQTNGLVERANRSLGEGIKERLDARSKNWMEELPHAVIPAEIGIPTLRTSEVDLVQNNEALEINLDLLEERREEAAIREAKSKAKMEKYYNSKVRNTSFKPGDLVYRNNDASRAEDTGKLGPK